MSWETDADINPDALLAPPEYIACFRRALRRMAVTLNLRVFPPKRPGTILQRSDRHLHEFVTSSRFADGDLFVLQRVAMPDENLADDDVAEHFFYGWFDDLTPPSEREVRRVIYYLPEDFLEESYRRLHPPPYTIEQLGAEDLTPFELMATCATNYILKNFWHNFVHNVLQGITHDNYTKFGGNARFESDFEADNFATILLAKSYGMSVRSDDDSPRDPDERILQLLRRNRCNRIFAARATRRGEVVREPARDLRRFVEEEWQLRRTAANYVGGRLLASGRAVGTVGIYLTGKPVHRGEHYRREKSKIVVQVNGMRFATKHGGSGAALRRASLRDYSSYIAGEIDSRYAQLLRERPRLKSYATEAIRQRLAMAGL